jgi:hypothetical protein
MAAVANHSPVGAKANHSPEEDAEKTFSCRSYM